jgi:hypothetical protein
MFIDKVTKHYEDAIVGALQEIEVPEWEASVFYRPSLTLRQQQKLINLQRDNKETEALVEMLIMRALDVDGEPLFGAVNKRSLMQRADTRVIHRIIDAMNSADDINLEIAEKK